MDSNKIISEILKLHGDYSKAGIFNGNPEEVRLKTEALNELLDRIETNLIHGEEKQRYFAEAIDQHFKSFSKGLFYKRNLTFND